MSLALIDLQIIAPMALGLAGGFAAGLVLGSRLRADEAIALCLVLTSMLTIAALSLGHVDMVCACLQAIVSSMLLDHPSIPGALAGLIAGTGARHAELSLP